MKPTIGRDVHYVGEAKVPQAAKVTHVWDERDPAAGEPALVNLIVFGDGAYISYAGSVPLYETREAAIAELARREGRAAYWPPRV